MSDDFVFTKDVQKFAIAVEKELCSALGIEWSPTGISIKSLIERLKNQHPDTKPDWNAVRVSSDLSSKAAKARALSTEELITAMRVEANLGTRMNVWELDEAANRLEALLK